MCSKAMSKKGRSDEEDVENVGKDLKLLARKWPVGKR